MTTDYAEPLKRVWEHMSCYCDRNRLVGAYRCEGHAALLEMVDGHHLLGCECGKVLAHRSDPDCWNERRRLRAAVGVEE